MSLLEEVDKSIMELKITSLDISFNEIADMYANQELIINPDYQRTFRWSVAKQSRFIESLILEMPIPSIYVIEIEDGTYELIDGLQRISSYLNFRGLLKNKELIESDNQPIGSELDDEISEFDEYLEETVEVNEPLKLAGCDILLDLNGLVYDELPNTLKIRLKRAFIRMEVLRKGIDSSLKYHMFKRLNTGGEQLSPQEVRNCTIILVDNTFINFINRLYTNADFCKTISSISELKLRKKYAGELILRYFAVKNDMASFVHDVSAFLTNYMEKVALSDSKSCPIFNYEVEEKMFSDTFRILNRILGEQAFSAPKKASDTLVGFNVYHFEVISCAMQEILLKGVDICDDDLKRKIIEIKLDPEFRKQTTGGGKNSIGALLARYNFAVEKLKELIK